MTSIALRNLWSRKLRTFLTSLAVVLGVMMVAGTYVLTDTIDQSFGKIFAEGNRGIDAVITSKEAVETDDNQEPSFDDSVLAKVRETDGVAKAQGGILDPTVSILDKDGEPIGGNGAPTFGSSTLDPPFDALKYVEGGKPASDDQVVIDKQTADRGDYSVGDPIKVVGKEDAKEYELAGIATLGDVDSFGGASIAIFTFEEAQRVTSKQGQLDQISVAATEGVSPAELKRRLSQALPKTVEAETGTENTASQKEDVGEFIGFLKTALLIFAGVSLFVAAFLIFNTFSITVAQRTREFAMLRTLGANRRQLVLSVVIEAFVIGLIASVLGLLAGIGFAPAINSLFQALEIDLPNEGTVIATRTIVVSLVIGIGLTVLASLIPALRITRVPPVAGLREGAVLETSRSGRRRTAIATVLTGLGLVAMILGRLRRAQPGRGVGGHRRRRHVHRRGAAQPEARAPDGVDRGQARGALPRRARAAGARERGPQPRPHRLHGRRADDRPGAGLVRGDLRRGPARLDRRGIRQDHPGRFHRDQQGRLLGHLAQGHRRDRGHRGRERGLARRASPRPTWRGRRAATSRSWTPRP